MFFYPCIMFPVLMAKALHQRLSARDRERIAKASLAPVRNYVDGNGKRRCVGTKDLKPTQRLPQIKSAMSASKQQMSATTVSHTRWLCISAIPNTLT